LATRRLDFQAGIGAARDAGDGLRPALHTPAWCESIFDRHIAAALRPPDFVRGEWPEHCVRASPT